MKMNTNLDPAKRKFDQTTMLRTTLIVLTFILCLPISLAGTINCDVCYIDECYCTITGCDTPGIMRVWTSVSPCEGDWEFEYPIYGSSLAWSPENSETYFLKVFDGKSYCTPCTPLTVGMKPERPEPTSTTTIKSQPKRLNHNPNCSLKQRYI